MQIHRLCVYLQVTSGHTKFLPLMMSELVFGVKYSNQCIACVSNCVKCVSMVSTCAQCIACVCTCAIFLSFIPSCIHIYILINKYLNWIQSLSMCKYNSFVTCVLGHKYAYLGNNPDFGTYLVDTSGSAFTIFTSTHSTL